MILIVILDDYSALTSLKQAAQNGVKVLSAIGGNVKTKETFNDLNILFRNASLKQNFISSSIKFLRKFEFDGINLDWHFSRDDWAGLGDKQNLASLISDLRISFQSEAKSSKGEDLLLTMTLPSKVAESRSFDIPKLDPIIDFYCLLTYDYHSPHERSVNHHSPLRRSTEMSACNTKADLNVDSTVKMYIERGVTKSKLILGIPLYGKCFTLENKNHHKTGSPSIGHYKNEPCNKESFVPYSKLCPFIKMGNLTSMLLEPCNVGPYIYGSISNETKPFWIGYDDNVSAQRKGAYASLQGLGGISFWALEHDDYKGDCNGTKFPLIKSASQGLLGSYNSCNSNTSPETNLNVNDSNAVNPTTSLRIPFNRTSRKLGIIELSSKSYNPFRFASSNIYTGIWGVINCIIGIFGNLLTLIAIPYAAKRRRHELHKHWDASTIFILNLSLFDLGFCLFGMPHDILMHLGIGWPFGSTACTVYNFFGAMFAYGEWYSLGLIAITRALYVMKTQKWQKFCEQKRGGYTIILGLWILNTAILLPKFYGNGKSFVYDPYSDNCQLIDNQSSSNYGAWFGGHLKFLEKIPHYMAFGITTLSIIVSYYCLWRHVRKSSNNMNIRKNKTNQKQARLTITLTIICSLFLICVLPLMLLKHFVGKIGYNVVISIYWAQYSINVFVYAARRDEFWKAYQDIFALAKLPFSGICGFSTDEPEEQGIANRFSKTANGTTNETPLSAKENPVADNKKKTSANSSSETGPTLISSNGECRNEIESERCETGIETKETPNDLVPNTEPANKNLQKMNKYRWDSKSYQKSISKSESSHYKYCKTIASIILSALLSIFIISIFVLMLAGNKTNTKLLVLGGYTSTDEIVVCSGWLDDVEVIDLEKSSTCIEGGAVQFSSQRSLDETSHLSKNFPKRITDSAGGMMENTPVVCGGINENWVASRSCYAMIDTRNWKPMGNMSVERSSFASIITKQGLLVIGGLDRGRKLLDSVEILSSLHGNFTNRKQFETPIFSSCMAAIDDNNVLLIGGYLYGFKLTNKMWKYAIQEDSWEEMPPMRLARAQHSCIAVRDRDDNSVNIVVAGGAVEGSFGSNSVEIFDPVSQAWIGGPDLPFNISLSQLIDDGLGDGGAMLIGGRATMNSNTQRLESILHLPQRMSKWKRVGRDIKIKRASHVAMMIPETLISCDNKN